MLCILLLIIEIWTSLLLVVWQHNIIVLILLSLLGTFFSFPKIRIRWLGSWSYSTIQVRVSGNEIYDTLWNFTTRLLLMAILGLSVCLDCSYNNNRDLPLTTATLLYHCQLGELLQTLFNLLCLQHIAEFYLYSCYGF